MGHRWEGMETCNWVTLAETVMVLDGHEMIMSANVRAVSDDITGIIEPTVQMARVVAKCPSGY